MLHLDYILEYQDPVLEFKGHKIKYVAPYKQNHIAAGVESDTGLRKSFRKRGIGLESNLLRQLTSEVCICSITQIVQTVL